MNTDQENLLAVSAFKTIAAKYGKYLQMNPSVTKFSTTMITAQGIDNYVKFMDNSTFMFNYNMSGSKRLRADCSVCGFTAPKLADKYDREMYINRQFANASTVVHEMLHFLTHPLFWDLMTPAVTEAVTEYFTRKVIKSSQDDNFDISQRKDRYEQHHSMLAMTRGGVKLRVARRKLADPGKGYMKRAFFQGDITALSFIKNEFASIEEALAEDAA